MHVFLRRDWSASEGFVPLVRFPLFLHEDGRSARVAAKGKSCDKRKAAYPHGMGGWW